MTSVGHLRTPVGPSLPDDIRIAMTHLSHHRNGNISLSLRYIVPECLVAAIMNVACNHSKGERIFKMTLVGSVISIFIFLSVSTMQLVSALSINEASLRRLKKSDNNIHHHRREVIGSVLAGAVQAIFLVPSSCQAIGEGGQRMVLTQKPSAPIGALIPATQQRLLLEKCIYLSKQLTNMEEGDDECDELIIKIKALLAPLSPTLSKKNEDLQVLQQSPPNRRLQGDVARATMNIYTSSLRNPDKLPEYTVMDPAWKKSYIRQYDGLPNIAQVMQADLDLRDLYRNAIVTKLDDASAELYNSRNMDVVELNQLLAEAAAEFDLWLGRIEDAQVQQALQAALEGKTSKIYDSYYAGFVPHR
jgi:hypothetical protein